MQQNRRGNETAETPDKGGRRREPVKEKYCSFDLLHILYILFYDLFYYL